MSFLAKGFFTVYKLLISLKLAVFTISLLAVLTGLGTFIESRYDQETANKIIYSSVWMKGALCLLALSLTMVLIDRWPWKKRQTGFVTAHIGLLILISGAFLTHLRAVDGSIRLKEGKSTSQVTVSDMEIKIYSSYDGENFTLIHEEPVDMFFIQPNENKPHIISTGGQRFVIDKYLPFALGRTTFKIASQGPPAVRWHLEGAKASTVEWMRLENKKPHLSKDFGPARITLTSDTSYRPQRKRELVLLNQGDKLFYSLAKGGKKQPLKKGQVFSTRWMDLKFRLLEFLPQSQKEFVFTKKDRPSDFTIKALRIRKEEPTNKTKMQEDKAASLNAYRNDPHQALSSTNPHQALSSTKMQEDKAHLRAYSGEQTSWIGQNSYIRFFEKNRVYVVGYLNQGFDLGFNLTLVDFKMTKYPGWSQAKEYESEVQIDGQTQIISMNKPLKHKGWTFYQSSFEDNPNGTEPDVSIFSVNRDPGRPLKYTGSALVTAGIALLFYRRKIKKIV